MASTQNDEKPKDGDLIEIFRCCYQHWAVYVGDDFIVHITSTPDVKGSSANCMMSVRGEKALVKKEKLSDVVGKHKWRINNILDKKYKPRPAHVIVKEAEAKVGEAMKYSVIMENCEHFATEMRYGEAESRQVIEGGKHVAAASLSMAGEAHKASLANLMVTAVASGGVIALVGVPAALVLGIGYWLFGGKKENKNKE